MLRNFDLTYILAFCLPLLFNPRPEYPRFSGCALH